jgi:hypothetical protein
VKIDLTHLTILETELRERLQIEWGARQYFHASCKEHGMSRPEETLRRGVYIRNIRVPLAGLRLIQLTRQCLEVSK